jgi:hypothetical protein
MSEQTTTNDSPEIDVDSAVDSLGDAFNPEPADSGTSEPQPQEPAMPETLQGKGLPEGSAWGGEPAESGTQEPRVSDNEPKSNDFDFGSIDDNQFDQLLANRWGLDGVDGIKSLRKAYDEAKGKIKELETRPADSGDIDKLRREYEAIDRIRNSAAWDNDVMAPQAQALDQAKQIGQSANLEEYQVTDLFAADNAYDVEKQLTDLQDPAAANLLRPLAMQALEARQKGIEATRSKNPIQELEAWQNRSRQLENQNNQQLAQQDLQVNLDALESVFTSNIQGTPIGGTAIANQVREAIAKEIQNGQPLDTGQIWEGQFWGKMAPITNGLLAKQASEIAQLKAELAKVGGLPDNRPSPTPPATGNRVAVTGGLPAGQAWGTG